MKWLCRVGIHKFKPWAFNSMINPLPIERCGRCGVGRQFNIAGFGVRYSPEQMLEAEKTLRTRG